MKSLWPSLERGNHIFSSDLQLSFSSSFLSFILLTILFICISNDIPQSLLSLHKPHISSPFFFPLPLMSDEAILCYICSWSHGSLHVYSLVGDLVPGSSGVLMVQLVNSVLPMWLQSPSALSGIPLTLPLGLPCSVQWLAVSTHISICQEQAESLRGQLY